MMVKVPLRAWLPPMPEQPEIDEDGDKLYRGFQGDCSNDPRFVTDGRLLLLAEAIDPAFPIERSDGVHLSRNVAAGDIDPVWKLAEQREDLRAQFLGTGTRLSCVELAFLRDVRGRVMVLDAYLFGFALRAVRADALTVSSASPWPTCTVPDPGAHYFTTPLALRREAKLVGLLMPTRLAELDCPEFDLTLPPLCSLNELLRGYFPEAH